MCQLVALSLGMSTPLAARALAWLMMVAVLDGFGVFVFTFCLRGWCPMFYHQDTPGLRCRYEGWAGPLGFEPAQRFPRVAGR